LEFGTLLANLPLPKNSPAAGSEQAAKVVFAANFTDFVKKLESQTEFAFDTETTSLDILEAKLIGASFSWGEKDTYYLPLSHLPESLPEGEQNVPLEAFINKVGAILSNPQIKKYGQNAKYDINVLAQHGVEVKGVAFDTMVGAYVLNPERASYNLTVLASDYLGRGTIEYEDVLAGKGNLSEVEVAKVAEYASQDALYVWLLTKELSKKITEENLTKVLEEIEMPLVLVLAAIERKGVKIDSAFLATMSAEFALKLDKLRIELYALAGAEFNLNSPKQLSEILFNKLNLSTKGLKKTKTGISTDSSVLEKLRTQHPIAELLLQYRMIHKLKSTYVDTLPTQVSKISGRLHSRFNQTGTATGRLSSSEPNLQNIPIQTAEGRRIREAFIAEPGYKLISADYSQIELRLLAHLSADKNLIAAFDQGVDIHSKTAREIFGLTANQEPTPEQRRAGKTINFGVIYGMGAFRLGRELAIPFGVATTYIENYFQQYPMVKKYFAEITEDASVKGYVTTLLGRKRKVTDIDTAGRDQGFMLRAAINAPIQGSAADLIKIAMNRLLVRLSSEHVKAAMIMQIHDELVFECLEQDVRATSAIIQYEMEHALKLDVPLKVEIGIGDNWDQAHG